MELLNRDAEGPLDNVVPFGAPNGPLGKLNTGNRMLRTAQVSQEVVVKSESWTGKSTSGF